MRLTKLSLALPLVVALLASCTDQPTGPSAVPGDAAADVAGTTNAVVITEIMADPNKVLDTAGEWFEVYNAGSEAVNLKGWQITSGPTGSEKHTIATDVVVASHAYAVLGNNTNSGTNGGLTEQYSYGTNILLNNSNTDWLTLKTPTGTLVDSVSYAVRTNGVVGSYTVTAGTSRAVVDVAVDNTIISGNANWKLSTELFGLGDKGTPGSGPGGTIDPAGPVATVTVGNATVNIGATAQMSASAVDAAGRAATTTYRWASLNPSIATVDSLTGLAKGVGEGIATLSATSANGVVGTGTLTVSSPNAVASISLSVSPPWVPAGYTKPVFATARTATNGIVSPPPAYTWASSDPSVATVDSLGYINAIAAGKTVISATAPNGIKGSVNFSVDPGDAPTTAVYRNHLEFGTPAGGTLLVKRQYALSYNAARGGPNWVSWNLNGSHFGTGDRCDCFTSDQTLPAGVYRVFDFDYRNSGYDRGHMVQSESRTSTDQENAATFLLTNILPQAHNNNAGPWGKFENYLNDLVRTGGKEVYVVAGGEYSAHPQTLKGEGKVAVPEFTWKVAVILPAGQGLASVHGTGDLQVLAVRMPNDTISARNMLNEDWPQYKVKVDEVEARTGLDVLDALPDAIERIVEADDHPPVAHTSSAAYTGSEGSSVSLDGTASTDPDGDALTYTWDFGDGTSGTGATAAHVYGQDGTYTARLTVTDPYGAESTVQATVTIANVAPAVAAFAGGTLLQGETFVSSGTFADPGADAWTATVDWGDGAGAEPLALSGTGFDLSHVYSQAGTHTVTVTVSDADGGSGSRVSTVVVQTPQTGVRGVQSIVSGLAADGAIERGAANSLAAKLRVAVGSLDRGDNTPATNQLMAFVNEVDAMVRSDRLSEADGRRLIDAANRVIASIASL
jgi:DNA/RNA endonuclease G (NUC1)